MGKLLFYVIHKDFPSVHAPKKNIKFDGLLNVFDKYSLLKILIMILNLDSYLNKST